MNEFIDSIDKGCGYEDAREAFEVCALAVIKSATLATKNSHKNTNGKESVAISLNKENKQLKNNQSKRKSILMSPSKFGQSCNISLRSDSMNDMTDPAFTTKGIPMGMSTTSSKKSISSNTSSHARYVKLLDSYIWH